jgi:hypothetical protein
LRKWDEVRREAEQFANQLNEEDIIAITESAFGNSPYAITITVWYKER